MVIAQDCEAPKVMIPVVTSDAPVTSGMSSVHLLFI